MLNAVHPSGGIYAPPESLAPQQSSRGRALVASLVMLHGIELLALLSAAGAAARAARAHPGHGAGLPSLLVLAAMMLVGWQAIRLLRGRRSLNVSGLAVQAGGALSPLPGGPPHLTPP